MAEYINSIEAAKMIVKKAEEYDKEGNEDIADVLENVADFIYSFPKEDVKPVIHAHWVAKKEMSKFPYARNYFCSNCEHDTIETGNYCQICGAIMDEEE